MRTYEPEITRMLRIRRIDQHLRPVYGASDVVQSVLTRFWVGASPGEFELTDPQGLKNLLIEMAINKAHDLTRRERAQKRGAGQIDRFEPSLAGA